MLEEVEEDGILLEEEDGQLLLLGVSRNSLELDSDTSYSCLQASFSKIKLTEKTIIENLITEMNDSDEHALHKTC